MFEDFFFVVLPHQLVQLLGFNVINETKGRRQCHGGNKLNFSQRKQSGLVSCNFKQLLICAGFWVSSSSTIELILQRAGGGNL